MILLIFGQPAAGKTTLAKALLLNKMDDEIHIDGDEWREVTKNKNYTKEGRMQNLKGAFDMALFLERQGYDIVLSFVTPYEELRQYLRDNAEKLVEVYLTYSGDRGRNTYFATEFDEPSGTYLHLDTSKLSVDECIDKIIDYIEK
jgi:adenylylsulfate kinase